MSPPNACRYSLDLFLFSAILAVLRRYVLQISGRRLIRKRERRRSLRVILLVHRQDAMSLGFPVFRYIDVNESEVVLRAIQLPSQTFHWTLSYTPGGLVLASLQSVLPFTSTTPK